MANSADPGQFDLDLNCLQRQCRSGSAGQELISFADKVRVQEKTNKHDILSMEDRGRGSIGEI